VQDGILSIAGDDWSSFLHPEGVYNPEAIGRGLLRGPFLVSVSVSVICMCITNLFILPSAHICWATQNYDRSVARNHCARCSPGESTFDVFVRN